jgi:hypothetical protein
MFSGEIRNLLTQVISSWQVLVVTVVLVIYISLVNYVARVRYRRSRRSPVRKPKPAATENKITADTDELGLEEQNE